MSKSSLALSLRRTLHPVYRKLETVVHPLRYLFLEITRRCNLNCLHCGSDCGKNPRPDELSAREWIDFVDYVSGAHLNRKDLFLVITGGEPLCHPELFAILDQIKSHKLQYGLVTNGFLLNEKNVDKMAARKLASITVSLDGLEETHDWLRNTPGSFQKTLRGMRLMARSPIPIADVVTCVNPRNIDQLPDMLSLIRDTNIRRWRLFNIFPKGRAALNRQLLLSPDEIKRMFDWIARARADLAKSDFFLDFACEGFLPKRLDEQVRDEPYFCRAGICIGSVLCDGAIAACPNISRSLVQGNIRTDDFFTVWENKFQPHRDRSWMKTGGCTTCAEWKRCKGNSLHLWDDERGQTALCYPSILKPEQS